MSSVRHDTQQEGEIHVRADTATAVVHGASAELAHSNGAIERLAGVRRMNGLRRVDPARRRGRLYRGYAWLSATRPFAWIARRIGWKLDPVLLRLTGGRLGAGLLLPTAVMETRGARTGAVRRNALIYFHDGDDVIVMAAHLGLPSHPSWFHNLVATPDVTFGGEPFRASVVEDDVDRLWSAAERVFPPYARYRRQAAALGADDPARATEPSSQAVADQHLALASTSVSEVAAVDVERDREGGTLARGRPVEDSSGSDVENSTSAPLLW